MSTSVGQRYDQQSSRFVGKTIDVPRATHPIVRLQPTDEDVGVLQGDHVEGIPLDKVVKLLTDPHSNRLLDRHIHALQKVTVHYHHGFLLKDLVWIFQLLNICADRVPQHSVYLAPMLHLLSIAARPFLCEKTSDQVEHEQAAVDAVSQLGYLMRVPLSELRRQLCDTIVQFYSDDSPQAQLHRLCPVRLSYRRQIVEQSDLAETLTKSLSLLDRDLDIKIYVLKVLQLLSKESASNCMHILSADGAQRLCSRIMDFDPSGNVLYRSTEILWNLLEYGSQEELTYQLNTVRCIGQLRDAFIQQLTNPRSLYDKELRNDLLVIASNLATICPYAPFLETGFLKQIALLATFQEVKSNNPLVKHLKLLASDEDYELKKLLINMLVLLSKDPNSIPVLSEARVLLALFTHVRALESEHPKLRPRLLDWSPAQVEELQLLVMGALCTLGPLLIDDYLTCQGSTRLLLLLEWCVGPADFQGTGNSFHGAGGRHNKKAQMRMCLRLLRCMVCTSHEQVLADLTDQGIINQLISILQQIKNHRKEQELEVDVEMQSDMITILSVVCETDMHRKELFGTEGVDILIHYLCMKPELLSSGLGHKRLLLTAIDAVWSCIVGCYTTEDYFLEKAGIFLLIDLLQICPPTSHGVILGCILDILENPKVPAHLLSWRGKGDTTLPHLLCSLWRVEEATLGVVRNTQGAIGDPTKPLQGRGSNMVVPLPANMPSMAIVDVADNLRAKIHAIFSKLGFIELPGINTADHVTLTIIEHYLDFKLGEVFTELTSELELEGVRPVTPDQEALEAIQRTVTERSNHVLDIQNELIQAQHQQDAVEEQQYYAKIRENYRQHEKSVKDFNDFVARTSSYSVLQASKQRQQLSIDASRVALISQEEEELHPTEIPDLTVTAFSGRYVKIDSTSVELTGGPLVKYLENTN